MNSPQSNWRNRSVLVTGWSGFLGSWLTRKLCSEGARVIGLSRNGRLDRGVLSDLKSANPFTAVQGSVADNLLPGRIIAEYKVETIFHLAAQSKVDVAQVDPCGTFEANIQGTWNLLEAVRNAGWPIRIVVASTDMASADTRDRTNEGALPVEGMLPYAASKACADLIAKCFYRTYDVKVCIARTSNLYGGGDLGFQRIIPGTIRAVICDEAPTINSNGLSERDYLYVEDAVVGYLALAGAMDRTEICGQTFNFSTESTVKVSTLVETILKLMGREDLKPRVLGNSGQELTVGRLSSSKAREHLKWSPDSTLNSGLQKTIEWYLSHAHEVRTEARN